MTDGVLDLNVLVLLWETAVYACDGRRSRLFILVLLWKVLRLCNGRRQKLPPPDILVFGSKWRALSLCLSVCLFVYLVLLASFSGPCRRLDRRGRAFSSRPHKDAGLGGVGGPFFHSETDGQTSRAYALCGDVRSLVKCSCLGIFHWSTHIQFYVDPAPG